MLMGDKYYKFGKYVVPKEEPDNAGLRQGVEAVAEGILAAEGIYVPPGYAPFIVVCKYSRGHGVAAHADNDYNSKFPWIVSFAPVGEGKFVIRKTPKHGWQTTALGYDTALIFNRFIEHKAEEATTEKRVSITVRWVDYGYNCTMHMRCRTYSNLNFSR